MLLIYMVCGFRISLHMHRKGCQIQYLAALFVGYTSFLEGEFNPKP